MPVGVVKVAEGCTLCGVCVNVCPTDVLSIRGNELKLVPALCIACGVCAEKCPEKVITVDAAADSKPYEARAASAISRRGATHAERNCPTRRPWRRD
jgi:MinD superfamily P-loop ATPase